MPRPRDCPNREEAILVSAFTLEGMAMTSCMKIGRAPDNKIIPGEWTKTCPAHAPLLECFFRGFSKAFADGVFDTEPMPPELLGGKGEDKADDKEAT